MSYALAAPVVVGPAPEKSHVIRLREHSTKPQNVAIPTTPIQILKESQGNYVRNCWAHNRLQPRPVSARNPRGAAGGPAQRALRPRSHTTHAPKTQTTSPKTPQIHPFSPKWSALWAHPSPAPPIWRQQQGLRGLPQCPWAAAGPGRTSETTHRSASFTTTPQVWRAPEGPEGLAGLRGAAPNEVRSPSLAGGRTLRRPEHQRGLAALPVGGGRAWPDNETTHRTTRQQPAPPAWRAPEGPEGTGSRTRRRPEH